MDSSEKPLSFGIIGSVSPTTPLTHNPSYLLSLPEVQKLMIQSAQTPKAQAEIKSTLAESDISLEDLLESGLLEQEGDVFKISFILFLKEDLVVIRDVCEELASSLAKRYLAESSEFRNLLAQTSNPHHVLEEVAFILIGCFSLDWDGLQITEELGYWLEPMETELGDRYVAWAEERKPEDARKIYWGSHNDYYTDCVLTTFGDHGGLSRPGFPDLAWRMNNRIYQLDLAPEIEHNLVRSFSPFVSLFTEQVGLIMLALAQNNVQPQALADEIGLDHEHLYALLDLLDDLNYIQIAPTNIRPIIPVLLAKDAEIVEAILTRSGKILVDWLPTHMDMLRERLAGITPLAYGLPFELIFSQIWHYLFGIANRQLVKGGLFADPYHPDRRYPGFIPAVWHPTVLPEETTF